MMSKLTRLSSILLKSTLRITNFPSSRFFSVSLSKSLSSFPNISSSSPKINFSPILSSINANRLYSSGGSVAKEMQDFLAREIDAEKANNKAVKSVPGFEVKADGAMVELSRKFKDESIRIRLNVNGSTTDEEIPELEGDNQEPIPPSPLLSKPSFSIEITKPSGKTLCLSCNFTGDMNQYEEEPNQNTPQQNEDIFEIEAITVLDKPSDELDDTVYMGDASLIDGQLYDILMDYLDERGIGKEFASHLIDYCTGYEHEKYIKLLEDLKSFVA